MDTQYYIELALKTPNGTEPFAKFLLGNNGKSAYAIFRKMHGIKAISETDLIYMDFVETRNGLPMSMDLIACTLDEVAENCKTITKELFKLNSLSLLS
jgi:hypothetical protein